MTMAAVEHKDAVHVVVNVTNTAPPPKPKRRKRRVAKPKVAAIVVEEPAVVLRPDENGENYYMPAVSREEEAMVVAQLRLIDERHTYERRQKALKFGRVANILVGGMIGALVGAIVFDIFDEDLIDYLQKTKYMMGLAVGFAFAGVAIVVGSRFRIFSRFY